MTALFETLFIRTWWQYPPHAPDGFSVAYHWFNVFEGLVWFGFASFVAVRHWRFHNSPLEPCYALTFAAFGLTDFREAWITSSALIWLKLLILVLLLTLRHRIMGRYYPGAAIC